MRPICSNCRRECGIVYVIQGYIGTYYECHPCHHGLPPLEEPELITDTFTSRPVVRGNLDSILDKLIGD